MGSRKTLRDNIDGVAVLAEVLQTVTDMRGIDNSLIDLYQANAKLHDQLANQVEELDPDDLAVGRWYQGAQLKILKERSDVLTKQLSGLFKLLAKVLPDITATEFGDKDDSHDKFSDSDALAQKLFAFLDSNNATAAKASKRVN